MEFLVVLLPFFTVGLICSVLARFSGVTISFLLAPAILYMGAGPVEFVAFMLTFLVYFAFAQETQNARLDFENLTFFGGWKRYALVAAVLLGVAFIPFVSIAVFLLAFILELGATMYKQTPVMKRLPIPTLAKLAVFSAVAAVLGVIGMNAISGAYVAYYYIVVGLGILGITGFAWYAGKNRHAMRKSWLNIWSGLCFFQGFTGIDGSDYMKGLKRSGSTTSDMFGIISMTASFVALLSLFILDRTYSMPALVSALGAALGTRLFGIYEYDNRGGFSLVATVIAVLGVLCLYLTAPVPTGFGAVDALFRV